MNGPESNNLPAWRRGIGFAPTCIATSKKETSTARRGVFQKINDRNSFISMGWPDPADE
jgi:hypothetical protein